MIFLIEYDRTAGTLVKITRFSDLERDKAASVGLEIEIRLLAENVKREIVVLEAASEDALRVTHDRYFRNVGDIAKAGGNAVSGRQPKDPTPLSELKKA